MKNLYVNETYTNATANHGCGESGWYETRHDNIGDLFKALQKEYGKCASKMYVGDGKQIGWVFEKKTKYQDVNEYYIQATWVEVAKSKPITVTKTKVEYVEF